MVLLGFDTATSYASIAAANDGDPIREEEHPPDAAGRPRHSEELLRAVERCVEATGGWGEIERIAVGLGPGSFTGLRIGIATARALAQARELPLAAVSSLAALGRGIATEEPLEGRMLLPVIDARRKQVFAALYGEDGEELRAPFVAAPEELAELVAELDSALLAAGDGSLRFRHELETAGVGVLPAQSPAHRVAARNLCALGAVAEPLPPERVEPIYLREPDAKRWRERDRNTYG
jgi:tRNA threonylcarbamoyladenosine biosynthesis protein TsaB